MVTNKVQILPLSQTDKVTLNNMSYDSSNMKNGYLLTSTVLAIFCYLIIKFNWFNEIEGQSETFALTVGFFSLVFLLGFRSSRSNAKKYQISSNSVYKYCGNLEIIEKRSGEDDFEIYFEIDPTIHLPVFFIQRWKYKSIFDEINVGDIVTFEYVSELNLFLKLDWKNKDLRQFKP